MPYKSDAQRRFFHSPGAKRAGISKETVKEYDEASKGKDLPERADSSQNRDRTSSQSRSGGSGKARGGGHSKHEGSGQSQRKRKED